jgi:hypothetical protein
MSYLFFFFYKKLQKLKCLFTFVSLKEVIQPHLPVRLPCYDLAPVTKFAIGAITCDFGHPQLPWLDGRCVQGPGTYSP